MPWHMRRAQPLRGLPRPCELKAIGITQEGILLAVRLEKLHGAFADDSPGGIGIQLVQNAARRAVS